MIRSVQVSDRRSTAHAKDRAAKAARSEPQPITSSFSTMLSGVLAVACWPVARTRHTFFFLLAESPYVHQPIGFEIMRADSCIRVQSVYIITPSRDDELMIGFGSEQSRAFTTWFILANRFFSSSAARSGHLFLHACVGLRTKPNLSVSLQHC